MWIVIHFGFKDEDGEYLVYILILWTFFFPVYTDFLMIQAFLKLCKNRSQTFFNNNWQKKPHIYRLQ